MKLKTMIHHIDYRSITVFNNDGESAVSVGYDCGPEGEAPKHVLLAVLRRLVEQLEALESSQQPPELLWIVARPDGAAWALPSLRDAELFMKDRSYPREWQAGAVSREDLIIRWPGARILKDWKEA